jgi:hypothetical protein
MLCEDKEGELQQQPVNVMAGRVSKSTRLAIKFYFTGRRREEERRKDWKEGKRERDRNEQSGHDGVVVGILATVAARIETKNKQYKQIQ